MEGVGMLINEKLLSHLLTEVEKLKQPGIWTLQKFAGAFINIQDANVKKKKKNAPHMEDKKYYNFSRNIQKCWKEIKNELVIILFFWCW